MYSERLKELRDDKGVTQKFISEFVGVSRGRYSQYEVELDIIPLKYLNVLCNFFEVSLDYIFNFTNTFNYGSSNDIDINLFKQRIKEFRKEKGITQKSLASVLNTVQPVIANYEKGKHLITTSFLYAICDKYKVSADYLLGKIDYPKYLN